MPAEKYKLLKKESELICLKEALYGNRVFMFRDDPTDFAFGGNKVRFYEYLIPEIIRQKPDVLLTNGSAYSNHIRVTAEVAALLGIQCVILLTQDSLNENTTQNVKISLSLGAKVETVGTFATLLKTSEYAENLTKEGKKVFLVPTGGHLTSALNAYVSVAVDSLTKLEEKNIHPKYIFLPCASGTTHAGLLCAASRIKLPKVISFAVANKAGKAAKEIDRFIKSGNGFFPDLILEDSINVIQTDKNDYGHPDEELLDLRKNIYKTDGILLDPTYNINAFYGMSKFLSEEREKADVLYINTGGYTGEIA
ncbi:MAG: pyridoxal-phosphate dependent enzyme [Lachnospiraceae bacterium]|nr:pyridoxal-phosphate dependent enzyme [Lachnospiraceae bacterium]